MYCKGAETAILEKTVDGPADITLSHINSYAEVSFFLKILCVDSVTWVETESRNREGCFELPNNSKMWPIGS